MITLKKIASLSLSLAIILLTFPATAILASWNSQPDSLLYPIKRGLEKTAIALTPESLLKTKLHFAFLDRRATEASVALIQQSSNQQVLDDIVTEAKAAQTSTIKLKSPDQKISASLELIKKVNQVSEKLDQAQPLTTTPPPTPTPTKPQPRSINLPAPIPSPIPQTPSPSPSPNPLPIIDSSPSQSITQTQVQLDQIVTSLETQLSDQKLTKEQQEKFEELKIIKVKRPQPETGNKRKPQPPSDEKVEKYKGVQCWNRAGIDNEKLVWSNGCRGRIHNGACTMAIVPLNESEISQYKQWLANGKPDIPGCN